jgi:UDP-glucuronate 4-epimerase
LVVSLVTGAAGFIGSHLCEALLNKGHIVIGIDNFNDYYSPEIKKENIQTLLKNQNFYLYQDSILNKEALNKIFNKHSINTIFHLAAYAGVRPSIENPSLYYETNINGTLNIFNLAVKHHIKRILFASSSSVYGNNEKAPFSENDPVDNPISPYAATKKCGEVIAYNYHYLHKIDIACLRFFTVYGPKQRPEMAVHKFFKMIQDNQEIPVYNNGNCLRDYTYIDDIIHGIIQILDSDQLTFDIINLGESKTISTLNLIELIEKALNKKAKIKLMPSQQGDVDKTFADISHAKNKYGYQPKFPIEKGIELFADWFKNQKITDF